MVYDMTKLNKRWAFCRVVKPGIFNIEKEIENVLESVDVAESEEVQDKSRLRNF